MRYDCFKNVVLCGQNEKIAFAFRLIKAVFLGLLLTSAAASAKAQNVAALPSVSSTAVTMGTARPLLGWIRFCETHPAECAVDLDEPDTVQLTPQIWRTIVTVNQRVNGSIKAMTDADHWGVVDLWSFPDDGRGDCEDFQLLKRRILAESGLPRRAMRMTVVIDELGEGHAVLIIRTNQGDYVLDNKTSSVLPWGATGYVYIKRESQDAFGWVSLGGIATSPTTTANR